MTVWIQFRRRGIAVRATALRRYLAWSWRTRYQDSTPYRSIAAKLWAPAFATGSNWFPGPLRSACDRFGLRPDWIFYRGGGARYQAYDLQRGAVLLSARREDEKEPVRRAIAAQRTYPDLAPRVMQVAPDESAYIEELIKIAHPRQADALLDRVLDLLSERYNVRRVSARMFVEQLTRGDNAEGFRLLAEGLAAEHGDLQLPVTLVHGDICASNVGVTTKGDPVVLDWEYSRDALVSYDVWHLLFTYYREGKVDLAEWRRRFSQKASQFFGLNVQEIRVHAVLNLLDAHAFYSRQKANPSGQKIRVLSALLRDYG